jgi:hypothetical protein
MVVSVDCIMQSFAVELEASDLESDVVSVSRQSLNASSAG